MCSKPAAERRRLHPAGTAGGSRGESLALRLTAWYSLSSFAVLAAMAVLPYWVLARNLRDQDQELLRERVGLVENVLRHRPDDLEYLRQEVEIEWRSDSGRRFFARVLDGSGRVLAETPGVSELLPTGPAGGRREAGGAELFVDVRASEGRMLRTLSSRLGGGQDRLVQVALDLSVQQGFLGGYLRLLWVLLATSAAVSALLGYLFARRAIRPLRDITEAVLGTQASTLHTRLAVAGLPAELAVLASAYNEMLERLNRSFERLSRFAADIAHELRTPLNNLLGQGEVALGRARSAEEYRETLDSCLEEARRVSRIIDALLFLDRAEDPAMELRAETVDLGRELERVRDFYGAAAEEAQVILRAEAEGELHARVDRTLFQRAVANLVDNALRATAPGGSISLLARGAGGGQLARIEVRDSGAGIAPEHLPRVFDRFYRPDPARSAAAGGCGLGLAIVKSIATLHGGRAIVESEPGRGTSVILELPALPAATATSPAASAAELSAAPAD